MGRYIDVEISTEGLFRVAERSWSDVGLIGRGVGSGFVVGTVYTIKSPAEAKTLFGETSALYQSILLLFSNGANKVVVVPTGVEAQTQEVFNGTGSVTEFTLSAIPAQPLDAVKISSVVKTEGEDFYVDYGNKKVIFYIAPPVGTGNVTVDYSKHTLALVQAALLKLEDEDVQIVLGAMIFDSTLLSPILTHCVAMKSTNPRIGIYMLKNGEISTALAATLQSALSVLIAHKSLKDVAAACAGVISGLQPWKDLTMKTVDGIEQTDKFTTTQITAFDVAHIITMFDPPKLTGTAKVFSTGWTLDDTGTLEFIDQVRVTHHIQGVLELGLTNPNVIGEMRMNRTGLTQLDDYMRSLLNPWRQAGELDNFDVYSPALNLFRKENPDETDVEEMAALQASRHLDGAYTVEVSLVYSGSIIYIKLKAALTGGV